MSIPEVKVNFPVCTCAGRLLGGQKGRGHHPLISVDIPPTGLCSGIHLGKKLHSHLGEGLGLVSCEKRNKIIG